MKVKRLPTAGETLLGSGYRVDFGGKGSNQAVGCARLGAQVEFVASIGQDSFGEMALGLYREEGVGIGGVKKSPDAPTGVGFIVVEESTGENCIVLDAAANELLTAAEVEARMAGVTGGVVMTQLEIPVEAAEAAMRTGRAQGATTILNPAPVRPLAADTLRLVDVLTPNQTEARVLTGRAPDAATGPQEVARELIARGVKQVVMTLGEKGALIVTREGATHVAAEKMTAVDTTGAGDAFNAGLAVALASGENLEDAVRFAVVTGGLAVTKEGVIPALPRGEDVVQFYEKAGRRAPEWLSASVRA
jgi:ribokinase